MLALLILFLAPNGALYGITRPLRPGQAPGDLWRAHHEHVSPPYGVYTAKQADLSDWVYLAPNDVAMEAIRTRYGSEAFPASPGEWTVLADFD